MNFKVYCRYDDYANDMLSIYIYEEMPDNKRAICKSLDKMEFELVEDEFVKLEPTLKLQGILVKPFLQAFANELNKTGIRADKEPVLENELTATQKHLEDMRKIAFKKLGVE